MRFFDFVSVKLSLWLIIGILIGYYLEPNIFLISLLLFVLSILLFLLKRKQRRNQLPYFGYGVAALTIVLGAFVIGLSNPHNSRDHYSTKNYTSNSTWRLKIKEVLKPTAYSYRYFAKVRAIDESVSSGQLLLTINRDTTTKILQIDDELLVYGTLHQINPPLNPGQFDYREYLRKQGVLDQLNLDGNNFYLLETTSRTLMGIASNFREQLIAKLKQHNFGEEELGVVQALLLGQRHDISEETYNNYKNAGAVHILAVSGLHVGILLLILQFLLVPLERLRNGKLIKLTLVVLLLWVFAFITGLSPSIVRAVTMFSFVAYAMYLNRPTSTLNIIALSLFFLLLIKPLFLFQVGFQMSYAAVFAIVWLYPKLQRFWYPENWFVRKVWQLSSVSVGAQLGVLPISLYYFHQFPALFFVSNLVVVPFLGIILGMGILVIILAYTHMLPAFLVQTYNFLIGLMNATIEWVAQREVFVFKDVSFDGMQLLLGYLLVFGFVFALSKINFKNLAFFLGGIALYNGYLVYNERAVQNKEKLVLAHQTRNTVLLHQQGNELNAIATDSSGTKRLVTDYKVSQHIASVQYKKLKNSYLYHQKQLLILDSTGIVLNAKRPNYLLLTQSPKINLTRLLDSVRPKMVIADGSNYKTYVERWKQTCEQQKTPFHYTGEKGAYHFHVISKHSR